jgi:methylthioribose-1-phosphate isomerase
MNLKTRTLQWDGTCLRLLDQRKLPEKEEYFICRNDSDVAVGIRDMIVRGAPAIGASAAFGYYLGTKRLMMDEKLKGHELIEKMNDVKKEIGSTRPTAVNLFWALERMEKIFIKNVDNPCLLGLLEKEAYDISADDIRINKTMGKYGAELLNDGDCVLTHCNAGALATVDYGTALGVIRAAIESGKKIRVFADETRPYLQGARLTAWELMKDKIDVTVITDNMAGWVMKLGKINAVIVGADRIAANGDVANKIGTYMVAVLARKHNIPFYVAAPVSTIDIKTKCGSEIPIEERSHDEVRFCGGREITPAGVKIFNPAFDVTDNDLISAIITERGILRQPYSESIGKLFID